MEARKASTRLIRCGYWGVGCGAKPNPNQSSVPKAFQQFDENDRMKPSPFYNRMVDVMEELMKFTILTRSCSIYLTNRYSERVEAAEKLIAHVNATE